ncbi:MAG: hypothetical protein ABIF71_08975 [Planctomycetota bacterium]
MSVTGRLAFFGVILAAAVLLAGGRPVPAEEQAAAFSSGGAVMLTDPVNGRPPVAVRVYDHMYAAVIAIDT